MSELNISLPLLDPAVHSFGTQPAFTAYNPKLTLALLADFVRSKSPFLLSATLCAASRFLRGGPDTTPELVTSIPPEKARAVHESCLRLAHQHMHLAFQHAITTLEVVQAMTLLSIWKEPDDDKAGFYFNRVSAAGLRSTDSGLHPRAGRCHGKRDTPWKDRKESAAYGRGSIVAEDQTESLVSPVGAQLRMPLIGACF